MLSHCTAKMALGEMCCTIDISKTLRSSKTGFLFFLLLQMSLLSKVWTSQNTTDSPTTSLTTDTMSSTMSETASQNSTIMNPESVSSSNTSDQSPSTATLGSSVTEALATSIQSTAFYNATVALTGINSTDTANTSSENYSALSCPAFVCTTDCYTQFMNTTAKSCQSSEYYCKIMKQDAGYSVSCSASCGVSCGNGTLSNCSVNCCNTTNCLNNTLLGMSNSVSTTATTKPIASTTIIKATVPTTQASNGKKCHNISCVGAACYKTNTATTNAMMCPVGQDYCMLQKTASGTTESWQAGCSPDCRKMTVCTSTTTVCYLECCNATTTASCLKLTGDVNMPSSATRGLHCPALLTASLLLLWIVKVFT